MMEFGRISHVNGTKFTAIGSKGFVYEIDIYRLKCNCFAGERNQLCYHIIAVELMLQKLQRVPEKIEYCESTQAMIKKGYLAD